MSVLWEQARMVMRIAALNNRDPREPAFAAELLALRGLYDTPDAAQNGLAMVGRAPEPARAAACRRGCGLATGS
jgi:hypothetical protein